MRKLILSLAAVGCFMAAGQVTSADVSLQFRIDSDSLRLRGGQQNASLALSALSDKDTLRVVDIESLVIYSQNDSIVVAKTAKFVPVTLKTPVRTLNLLIWFASSYDWLIGFVDTLRQYKDFGHEAPPASSFGYSAPDDPNLVKFREKYHLDQVAGNGSEANRMINLMEWVHRKVQYDGSSNNPVPRNALNIIQVCADSNRGVNCRMLATVLNEAYLACGFASRHLTCLPRDKDDQDCHVINMVWSDSLKKWIYMDPTFQAYFMDRAGVLQSPEEVREALISGDSLVSSPDLDDNGQPYDPLQYRTYMAKNLFRFSAPLDSEFGYESKNGLVEWVHLNPLRYDAQLVGESDTTATKHGDFVRYYTNNAVWFWGK